MVIHEGPCIDGSTRLSDLLTEALQKPNPILLLVEEGPFIDPSHRDVMQGAGDI